MIPFPFRSLFMAVAIAASATQAAPAPALNPPPRPPAVPLAIHNPYFGLWSPSDQLNGSDTQHWTAKEQRLEGMIRVDGKVLRVIGRHPVAAPALPQTSVQVLPTRTVYAFANAQIKLELTFLTPVLPDDIEVLARPLTYVIWNVSSADGAAHEVSVFLGLGDEISVNTPDQSVVSSQVKLDGLAAAKVGTVSQRVLASGGDDWRIDWGYGWVAAPSANAASAVGTEAELYASFDAQGTLPTGPATSAPHPANTGLIAVVQSLGNVTAPVTTFQMLAYDEVYALQYMKKNLKPYWKHAGAEMPDLLKSAVAELPALTKRCEAFDAEVSADAEKIGGPEYAYLCAMAYRQALAANGLVADVNGAPLMMPKENSSNGCIATIDVHFPMIPEFLLFFPSLAKATLVPAFDYSASAAWPYPYAPHDLGTYPRANGQVYGMGGPDADRMPVEESGNLILMAAAVCHVDGNVNFASKWWPQLTAWVGFLEKQGFDPENQLCTDDFAGHLAHNSNLSVKAILAIAAYGKMADMRGEKDVAAKYRAMAKDFALKWMKAADDGDHYNLAFDKKNTWSMKYNLVWDKILGLDTFPAEVAAKEMAHYRRNVKRFGLPLDSRQAQTKSDWLIWSATLTNNREDFVALVHPLYDFYHQVPQRRAMVDWYNTENGKMIGFTARSVVGGYFLPFLYDAKLWQKWAARDKANPAKHIWAPQPVAPKTGTLVATASKEPAIWRYTTSKPAEGWEKTTFDASSWSEGKSGFGSKGTPGAHVNTEWKSDDIWLRREITLPAKIEGDVMLNMYHDEDVEVYIDGVLAARELDYNGRYDALEILPAAKAKLTPGAKVVLAIHCHQTRGGQYIDVGFDFVKEAGTK